MVAACERPINAAQNLSACRSAKPYFLASARLQAAELAMGAQDWANADRMLIQGLKDLGSRYSAIDGPLLDDTGMKLTAAVHAAQSGDARLAAEIRLRILQERLEFYADGYVRRC